MNAEHNTPMPGVPDFTEELDSARRQHDQLAEAFRVIYQALGIKEGSVPGDEKVSVTVLRHVASVTEEAQKLREALVIYTGKKAPVQGYPQGIPWDMHMDAYAAYCKRYGEQKALVDLEGRNCRGGFGCKELDVFIPGWRDELKRRQERSLLVLQECDALHAATGLLEQARAALKTCHNHRYSDGSVHHQSFDTPAVTASLQAIQDFLTGKEKKS